MPAEESERTRLSEIDTTLISGERVVFTTTKHWAAIVAASFWAILMLIGSFALAWIEPDSSNGLLGFLSRSIELIRLGLFLGGIGWIVYNVVAWRTAAYYVTTQRVLGHEGLIRRRSTDTLLTSISDVRVAVPFVGRMLGYGNIRIISTAGEAGQDTFRSMHQVEAFKNTILEEKAGTAASYVAAFPAAPAVAPSEPAGSTRSALEVTQVLGELAKLRDGGAITTEEYDTKKTELLNRI
jgi:uncharacterized membrane protein YdbT with pleckstrin-like domain